MCARSSHAEQGHHMTEGVIVAIIAVFGSIIVALLGYLGVTANITRRHAKAARFGVENEHPLNLRDDLDEKFHGLAALVRGAVSDIGGVKSDIRQVRREASDDRRLTAEALAIERERINKIENAKAIAVAAVAQALEDSTTTTTITKEK